MKSTHIHLTKINPLTNWQKMLRRIKMLTKNSPQLLYQQVPYCYSNGNRAQQCLD